MAKKGILTLRDIRKAKDMTLEDITRSGGPKISTYAKIESGKSTVDNMTVKSLCQLCLVFQMDPNTLLTTLGINWQERRD